MLSAIVKRIDIQIVPVTPEGHSRTPMETEGLMFTATVVGFADDGEKFEFETLLTKEERRELLEMLDKVKRRVRTGNLEGPVNHTWASWERKN